MPIAGDTKIASDHPLHDTVFNDQVMGRKAGIDFHAQRLGLPGEPFAEIGKTDDVVAAIGHQRREKKVLQ